MKVTVKINDRLFEVEVVNLCTQPIIAIVEGEQFEVWPSDLPATPVSAPVAFSVPAVQTLTPKPAASVSPAPTAPRSNGTAVNAVHAPIPGVIISIAVRPGDEVEIGQELCVLEAMKMKNSIRSPRAGQITTVAVAAGEHVKHHDLLFEYAS